MPIFRIICFPKQYCDVAMRLLSQSLFTRCVPGGGVVWGPVLWTSAFRTRPTQRLRDHRPAWPRPCGRWNKKVGKMPLLFGYRVFAGSLGQDLSKLFPPKWFSFLKNSAFGGFPNVSSRLPPGRGAAGSSSLAVEILPPKYAHFKDVASDPKGCPLIGALHTY